MKNMEKIIDVNKPLPTQNVISFVDKKINTNKPTYLLKYFVANRSDITKNNTVKIGFK